MRHAVEIMAQRGSQDQSTKGSHTETDRRPFHSLFQHQGNRLGRMSTERDPNPDFLTPLSHDKGHRAIDADDAENQCQYAGCAGDVRSMILAQTLKLTVVGVAIGLAGAFGVARFLTSLLYGVGTHDPVTFLGVAVFLILVAVVAAYVPAQRAMRVEPIVALRY